MATLSPAAEALGLWAPTLGAWFDTDSTLADPDADLSVALPPGSGLNAPATGVVSVGVTPSSGTWPAILAPWRTGTGAPLPGGHVVVLHRLLAEIETRLHGLLTSAADGWAGLARPPVRAFGLVANGAIASGTEAGSDLKRANEPVLQHVPDDARLWAFDARGRALDPGAVAAWWSTLAGAVSGLWATTMTARTATVAPGRRVQVVTPHGVPVADHPSWLTVTAATTAGAGTTWRQDDPAGAVTVTATGDLHAVALTPTGSFATAATIWAAPTGAPARDFVRVMALDVETHLVGVTAEASASRTGTLAQLRAANQADATLKVPVAEAATTFLTTVDDLQREVLTTLRAAGLAHRLVVGAADPSAAPRAALPTTGEAPPTLGHLPVTLHGLVGGGTSDTGPTVLAEIRLADDPTALAGCWIRLWPQDLIEDGTRQRLDGGAGMAGADGVAWIVVPLPPTVAGSAPLGMDAIVVRNGAARTFADVRTNLPDSFPAGAAVPLADPVNHFIVPDSGATPTDANAIGDLPAGARLVAARADGSFALVDPTTVPIPAGALGAVLSAAPPSDLVRITPPAAQAAPAGTLVASDGGSGATVRVRTRAPQARPLVAGTPLPSQERYEMLAVAGPGAAACAVLGGGSLLASAHELLPHLDGHPGAPATADTHGVGVRVAGPAAGYLTELAADYTATTSIDLATTAARADLTTVAATGAETGWIATLRTVSAQVEAEAAIADVLAADSQLPLTLNGLNALVPGLSAALASQSPAAVTRAVRALNRRLAASAYGAQEAATSLLAAVDRAEDLVYLEADALDDHTFGGTTGAETSLAAHLAARLQARPALHVVVCLGRPGPPNALRAVQRARAVETQAGLARLATAAGTRVAVFTPSAGPTRTLQHATTTVIVDDVYALVGTTRLWRRGLTFDSSSAVSIVERHVTDDRCQTLSALRVSLLTGALGIPADQLPDDPAELVRAISGGLSSGLLQRYASPASAPDPVVPSTGSGLTVVDALNPDGSHAPDGGFDAPAWVAGLIAYSGGEWDIPDSELDGGRWLPAH